MSRTAITLACVLLASATLSGCWVIEEIDRGSKWMDEHSDKGGKAKAAEAAAAEPAAKHGALSDYIQGQDAAGATKTFTPGQVSEGIVACRLGGSTQFMTRESCAARGGSAGAP
jgi:hypothetical protein